MISLMAHQSLLCQRATGNPQRFGRHLLEWDPGVGKTIAILALIDQAKREGRIGRTLVIAPLSVLNSAWLKDAAHFPALTVNVCWATTSAKRRKLLRQPGDVIIINPDSFKIHYKPWANVNDFADLGITRFVFDESDKLQNARTWNKEAKANGSQISIAAWRFSQTVTESYLLSGTPTNGSEVDYYGQLRCIDPDLFGLAVGRFHTEWFSEVKQDIGWKPRGFIEPIARLIGIRFNRPGCMRWTETNQLMSAMGDHFRTGTNWPIHFTQDFRLMPRTARLVRDLGSTREPSGQPYDSHQVLQIMQWIGSRLGDFDRREELFEKVEAVKGYTLIEAKREAFYERLRQRVWVLKSDECIDLPPATDNIREVILSGPELQAYQQLISELRVEFEDGTNLDVDASAKFIKLRQITGGCVKDENRIVQLGKSPAKLMELQNLMRELGKNQLVVFAEFTAEIDLIMEMMGEAGADAGRIDGRVSQRDRDGYIEDFDAKRIQYLVCQPAAAAHGLNLQTARYDCFYSTGFSPKTHDQARKRTHRNGQTEAVTHYYLVARGTVDEKSISVLKGKATAAEAIKELLGRSGSERMAEVSEEAVTA